MSEIQRLPPTAAHLNTSAPGEPVHPNAKTTTQVNNGTTTTKTNISSPVCHNCKTQTTPLWRRDETGQVLCNACGLFLKLHGRPRPSSLKTDTIKSRNRVKQSGSNSTKSSAPNTPKLESKDHGTTPKPSIKKSPKLSKKMDASQTHASGTPQVYTHQFNSPTLHLQNHHLSHTVQPLHYPSSTPTNFAPGLQRITSPLLLSNTSSISNTRNSNAASAANNSIHQAAGALENMSNELGPSATFQMNKVSTPISLINNNKAQIKREQSPVFSTPSSALNYSKPLTPTTERTTINSPSFGPQYHLSQTNPSHLSMGASSTPETLPPIQQVASLGKPSLPHISNLAPHQPPVQGSNNGGHNNGNNNNNNNHNQSNNENSDSSGNRDGGNDGERKKDEEITILKTRISELELVNDLYRTRIMELEAMEQAARLRENSMRRRLDEIVSLQEGGDAKRAKYDV
ncbi:hypothetical protein CANTEDRAFT_132166 [Yamadazyma tenuis ATCC 10573]|uniref:GATA-type domain-containing protein n=1 Tax=Candida tenuis (strain ATCC 10573 / BCRC 21748 / CBS 615 / JCM 9827 / NBRC 10315 / NRRL Y-1498 / VKM Y-70) TaxID=590646 RepID=G3BDU1_CANTC|nr:uncharacterized protein CANTEDRAFT_132166 [Yamadazyma tenuis ATCC 10573]EGV60379.1 hypothetical protein CANTEDRAFT_132166 [Yamadazyma tenuis ATCC 10573]